MVTVVEKQYQEEIPFETEEQPADELMTGEVEEVQKGENGQKDGDAVFTYENVQEVGKEVKSENTTKAVSYTHLILFCAAGKWLKGLR